MNKEKIGVQKDSNPDKDFHSFYSWMCRCGEWNDMIPFRWLAEKQYKEHRKNCSKIVKRQYEPKYDMVSK